MSTENKLGKIKHFVVMMFENRSFDHMLGYLYADNNNKSPLGHQFEGLTGNESNTDSKSGEVYKVFKITNDSKYSYFMPKADPGEGYVNTNLQLFGKTYPPFDASAQRNQGFVDDFADAIAFDKERGNGTISEPQGPSEQVEVVPVFPGTTAKDIMGCYTPEMLPVLSGLAKGYAVCDHWYCSVPTETMPNRAFMASATSEGRVSDHNKVYQAKSIFAALEANGQTWGNYGNNGHPLTRTSTADITDASNSHFGSFEDFKQLAENNQLPNYTFLEPVWGSSGNSQHPNYDVAKGEQYLQEIYNTLKNSPAWEETLLIVLFDEHGGCYDHITPPDGASAPELPPGVSAEQGFDFTRFGVRVPCVLISPWIEAGTVFRVPAGGTPLDHTSVLATLEERFNLPPLTARDKAAPHIGDVLTLNNARKDDPLKGIQAPTSDSSVSIPNKPSHIQLVHAETVSKLPVKNEEGDVAAHKMPVFNTEDEVKRYIHDRYREYYHGR